jgi:hypothetical protein
MSIATCSGSSNGGAAGGGFEWTGEYDDVANTVTIDSAGVGMDSVVLEQSDGRRARVNFAASGDARQLPPVPAAIQTTVNVTRAVVIGQQLVITGVTLKPIPPSKPGGVGGFTIVYDAWLR